MLSRHFLQRNQSLLVKHHHALNAALITSTAATLTGHRSFSSSSSSFLSSSSLAASAVHVRPAQRQHHVAFALQPQLIVAFRGQASSDAGVQFQCSECKKVFRLLNAATHHMGVKHAGMGEIIRIDSDGRPLPKDGGGATTPGTTAAAPSSTTPSATAAASSTPASTATATQTPPASSAPRGMDVVAESINNVAAAAQQQQQATQTLEEKKFVCKHCGKGFRIESALMHHYQTRHADLETPAPTTTASPDATQAAVGDINNTGMNTLGVAAVAQQQQQMQQQAAPSTILGQQQQQQQQAQQQYVQASETVAPQPPAYHLDAAPNAPEEVEIAVHSRCVNTVLLVGQCQDIARGYVFEDRVLQFTVVTQFPDALPGDPDRDFHTVRVFGEQFSAAVGDMLATANKNKSSSSANNAVMVSGRLRMIPQYEPSTGRYYHFPVIHVSEGSGAVNLV